MNSVFLDSLMFGCPVNATADEVFDLISSLLECREISENQWIRMYVSEQAAESVARAGLGFPPWKSLNDSILENGLPLNPGDVVQLMNGLLTRLPKVEEELGIRDILLAESICNPAIHPERGDVLRADFERLLGLISLFSEYHNAGQTDQCAVLTRPLNACPTTEDFSTRLEDVEPDIGQILPRELSLSVQVFGCSRRYLANLNPVEIWCGAAHEQEFVAAIEIYTGRAAIAAGLRNVGQWRLGRQLVLTIQGLNLQYRSIAESILRACSDTILGRNLGHTHAIRTTAAANSPQVRRGNDTAWRRDINYDLHLHYWSTPAGSEFAAVRQHNDMSIPE
jgi:hypothetical protein